jgi:hypothetical protein
VIGGPLCARCELFHTVDAMRVILNRLVLIVGAIILLLGIAGVAVPYFTTEQTKNVADVGPLHVRATEQQSHFIPPLLSDAAIAVGVVLMGVGLMSRR